MARNLLVLWAFIVSAFLASAVQAQGPVEDLLRAAQSNDIASLNASLQRGMEVDTADAHGNTLLLIASREGHLELAKSLLDRKANPRKRNAFGESALMLAALKGHADVVMLLHAYGAEVNHAGWSPLHYCAWGGSLSVCRYLIENKASLNALSANGTTPLMMAARQGHLEIVRYLLSLGADRGSKNQSGDSALSWALRLGNTDIADLLRSTDGRR